MVHHAAWLIVPQQVYYGPNYGTTFPNPIARNSCFFSDETDHADVIQCVRYYLCVSTRSCNNEKNQAEAQHVI